MTTLHERCLVDCPYLRARGYLAEMLQPYVQDRREQILTLNAALPHAPALQKNVLVRYTADVDPMHFDEPWHVSWTPQGGGPFPDFNGSLTVRADEKYEAAILELSGEYTPPLGVAGRAFDAALGHTIATVTAQSLLANLAGGMERRYSAEEAAKH